MTIELVRFAYTPVGTFGRLYIPEFECYTVERPWHNNKSRESCIPVGTYRLQLGRYNKGGYAAYEFVNVKNRSLIKIHKGNTMDDLLGCIALGRSLGYVNNKWAVVNSNDAYSEFMSMMNGDIAPIIEISNYNTEGDLS